MQRRFISGLAVCLVSLPALVVAQQTPGVTMPVVPPLPTVMPVVAPVPVAVPVQVPVTATVAAPVPAVVTTPPAEPEITVNIGGAPTRTGGLAPLPKVQFDLPPGLIPPTTTAIAPPPSILPPRLVPATPPAKLTPAQIAQQIAPNFNVTRDYVRLTQCYGMADFMGAVTRIQASRPGANPQIVNVARSIAALQDGMQPMVLAASTVRTEARFRADYDAIARRGQNELATSRTPNVTMQRRLATLDACRADVVRWRGGR